MIDAVERLLQITKQTTNIVFTI